MRVADYTSQRGTKVNLTVSYHSAIDLLMSLWILGERMADKGLADLDLGNNWFDDLAAAMSDKTRDDLAALGSGDVWIGLVALLPEAGRGEVSPIFSTSSTGTTRLTSGSGCRSATTCSTSRTRT